MLKRYKFNHDEETIEKALGISKRYREIVEMIKKWMSKHKCVSKVLEEIINSRNLSEIEKLYAAFRLGYILGEAVCIVGLFSFEVDQNEQVQS